MASEKKRPRLGPVQPELSDSSKKRSQKARIADRNRATLFIGNQIDRWLAVKEEMGVKTHPDVAVALLDAYEKAKKVDVQTQPGPSAMLTPYGHHQLKPGPSVVFTPFEQKVTAEMASESESITGKSSLSGIEVISSSDREDSAEKRVKNIEETKQTSTFTTTSKQQHKVPAGFSASFVDPNDLTIDVTIEDDDSGTDSDEDYEPSFDLTIGPCLPDDIDELSFADDVYGVIDDSEQVEEDITVQIAPSKGVTRLLTSDQSVTAVDQSVYICFRGSLLSLAHLTPPQKCKDDGCDSQVMVEEKTVGSALYLTWVCSSRHTSYVWCSQPVLRRGLHAGDLLTSAAVLFSGNNFQKISLMAKFMKMPMVSASVFNRIQRNYLVPAVEEQWKEVQSDLLDSIKQGSNSVIIAGDGRMDSPGHCAQFCTYTAMENESKHVLSVLTIDKRETGKSSIKMEKKGFLRTLDFFKKENIAVAEVITDAHASITATVRKDHPHIKHSYDVWHAAKNLAKKIMKASTYKDCRLLKQWCSHIINHFYHICGEASSVEEFTDLWFGVLHHVVNEHEWILGKGKCSHGPLLDQRDIQWMTKGSAAHDALRAVVADKRFLKNIPYFLNARSTADLEGFNNLITTYAGKRYSYIPPVYRARNLLAALDHNAHLNRQPVKNKDGTIRKNKIFNKKSMRWAVRDEKEKKTYPYIGTLLKRVFHARALDQTGLHKKVVLSEDDPRRISSTIASVLPPPKEQLIAKQKSRLSKKHHSP